MRNARSGAAGSAGVELTGWREVLSQQKARMTRPAAGRARHSVRAVRLACVCGAQRTDAPYQVDGGYGAEKLCVLRVLSRPD